MRKTSLAGCIFKVGMFFDIKLAINPKTTPIRILKRDTKMNEQSIETPSLEISENFLSPKNLPTSLFSLLGSISIGGLDDWLSSSEVPKYLLDQDYECLRVILSY